MPNRRLRVAALVLAPVLALVVVDRSIVLDREQWRWAAREVPRELLDPYRVEGLLRTLDPDRGRILLLGNSTGNKSFHDERFAQLLASHELHFEKATIGGASMATFGMLANDLAALEPRAAVLVVQPPAVRSENFHGSTLFYDWRAALELYTREEFFEDPLFHLEGLVGQATVVARQRSSIQRAFLVRAGLLGFGDLRKQALRRVMTQMFSDNPWLGWMRRVRHLDVYPNPNTRAIRRLGRELEASGSKLIVLEAPSQPLMETLVGPRRFAHFREQMARDAGEGGFGWVPADDFPSFDEDDFEDMLHLNEAGRLRFTEYIAPILAEHF